MNSDWSTALHESGHVCTAIVLGGKVAFVAIDGNGGLAGCECRSGTDDAIVVAAGPVAQDLLSDAPAPLIETVAPTEVFPTLPPVEPGDRVLLAERQIERQPSDNPSDAQFLARWAIRGREDDPECWAGRIAFVRHIASKIVHDHKEAIVRVATALYAKRFLFKEEIESLFEGQKYVC